MTVELLTDVPLNELRAYYKSGLGVRGVFACSGTAKVQQVRVQAVLPDR